ncbi:transposase family protein [Salininema proteolyticum]|uniref:Transposase family protein n=1 Tax=Salininema proteolyticum TaxID=1607685 RepID=A0ABV8TVN0_9ACTN
MLFYQAVLPLSNRTLNHVARLIRSHQRRSQTRWRLLNPGQQALMTLVYLHNGETYANLAAARSISRSTAWRRVRETVTLLAAQVPDLRHELRKARRRGVHSVLLDGTVIPTDRVLTKKGYWSGKHRHFGMNVQAIADLAGNLIWISPALGASTHDITAARRWEIVAALRKTGLYGFADKGFQGLAPERVGAPYKGRDLPGWKKAYNREHAGWRSVGERVFAELKRWKVLRRLRGNPEHTTELVYAITRLNRIERHSR